MIDRSVFFDAVRARPFGGKLTAGQVDGLTVLLDTWERDYAKERLAILAYCLATAKHETANTMQPIKELGGAAYLAKNYDVTGKNPDRARKMGNTSAGDGVRYAGRGFVQLTWKSNYRTMGELIGVDLVSAPDRAMEPVIAARIMFEGMTKGLFTGAKVAAFINASTTDFVGARRTVNGTDKATLIADYAVDFFGALKAAERPDKAVQIAAPAAETRLQTLAPPVSPGANPAPAPPDTGVFPPSNTQPGFIARFFSALVARLANRG